MEHLVTQSGFLQDLALKTYRVSLLNDFPFQLSVLIEEPLEFLDVQIEVFAASKDLRFPAGSNLGGNFAWVLFCRVYVYTALFSVQKG
jgi:hypothetical protein